MFNYKVCFIGDANVGKTSLIFRGKEGYFFDRVYPTIGAALMPITFEDIVPEKLVLSIWDTAGQERFARMLPLYTRKSHAIVICVEAGNETSYEYAKKLLDTYAQDNEAQIYLCVTKIDQGMVDCDELLDGVDRVFYTSAKDGTGVDELFREMALSIHIEFSGRKIQDSIDNDDLIRLGNTNKIRTSCPHRCM